MRTEKVVELPVGRKWFLSILQPVYNMSGTAYAVQVSSYDITESKQVEEALKESAEKYRRMEANIPGMVYTYAKHPDGSHSMPYANSASRNLFDIEPEDLMRDGNLLSDLIHPDDRERRDESIKLSAETLQPWRQELRYIVNGQVRWYDCRSRPQRQPNGDILWDGIMLETTERKQANEALRESEEKFRSLAEQSPNMIFIYSKGKIAYANKKCEEIMGYKREEFYSPDFDLLTLIAPESVDLIKENLSRHSRGEEIEPYEYTLISKAGVRIEAINTSKLIQYEGEAAILGIVTDITERTKAEEALRQSEARLKILFESAPDGIYLIDQKGNFIGGNKAMEEMADYRRDELFGKNFAEAGLLSQEQVLKAVATLEKNTIGNPVEPDEFTLKRKDGSYITVEIRTFPVRIGNQTLALGIARDISARKQAEKKLLDYQAQLKSLASQLSLSEEHERRRLATDLHDRIGQSLVISKIKLDQLRESESSDEFTKALEEVCNCLGQVIQDTRVLTFDLSSPILYELGFEAAVAEWLDEQIQEKHGIKTEFEDDGKQKPLDDDIQAILFRNVRELLINVVKHAQANKVKVSVHRVDEHIQVNVEDDGVGFDPVEVNSRAAGRAEFGLFSIRERLEQLGGLIEIESEPGRGSKITMTAPLKQTDGVRV
jgi:PAS domain S-box-containing protein